MSDSNDICAHCGAPRAPGYGACKFCGTVFARARQTSTQENVVPCPSCRTVNEWGAQRCVKCQAWVVVQCLFCSSLSPHHVPACLRCQEAFAGAPERFQQRQAHQQGQERMQVLGTVGNVAASFLGAAAGMAVGGAWSSGHGYSNEAYRHRGHHGSYDNDSSSGSNEGGFFSSILGGDSDRGGDGGGLFGGDDNDDDSDSDSGDDGDSGGDDGGDSGGGDDS